MCRYDMLRSHSLGEHSVFEKTLEAGLSAMKTHQCFLDKTKSNGCPGIGPFLFDVIFRGKMKGKKGVPIHESKNGAFSVRLSRIEVYQLGNHINRLIFDYRFVKTSSLNLTKIDSEQLLWNEISYI